MSILGAGAAAWVSGARTRNRLEEQIAAAAIPRVKAEGLRFGVTLAIFILPYLIGQAVAFARTAQTSPPGLPLWLAYAAMGLLVIVLGTAWGWALGRYLSSAYASLVSVLLWFSFEAYPGDVAAIGVVSGSVWETPSINALAIRVAAAIVFIGAVLMAPSRQTEWRTSRFGPIILLAAGATAILAVTNTTGIVERQVPNDPTCVDGKIEFCLWPEDARYAAMIQNFDARISSLPPGFAYPTRVNEYGIERMTYHYEGQTFSQLEGIEISEGSKWSIAIGLSNAIMTETLKTCNLDSVREDVIPEAVRRWLEFYLADSSTPDYSTSGVPANIRESWDMAAQIYTQSSPEEQVQWVEAQLQHIHEKRCAG